MKKFENPAVQFAGTWRVEAYDFREFSEIPSDLDTQLQRKSASFPVGQRLAIDCDGAVVMPGSYNTERMKFEGPVGEALSISFLMPLEKKLCTGYWNFVCSGDESELVNTFMIVEIFKWHAENIKSAKLWTNVKPVSYSWVSLSKQHSFEVWVTKGGDLILPIFLKGKGREGKTFGTMGVILKRIHK
ncbi:hypothetical protein [Massilia rubra]|uniref:Lipocalin-like domain-containing protein n=1 Tax=Massilia rubra TaxID=2607910 RepID=A0ABX0LK03_9BURK|nr:hypothetical protein [Massilia rubra]NHZ33003.1 hypothetical protein [Massilia rubra]